MHLLFTEYQRMSQQFTIWVELHGGLPQSFAGALVAENDSAAAVQSVICSFHIVATDNVYPHFVIVVVVVVAVDTF